MDTTRTLRRLFPLFLLAALAGCTQQQNVSVSVSPETVQVGTWKTAQFIASVSGSEDHGVYWSVQEGAAGGSVDYYGVYTAPSTPGTYHVIATTRARPEAKATATVTVVAAPPDVTVTMTPPNEQVRVGQTVQFTAEVVGVSHPDVDRSVTWSVQEQSGGTIDAQGLYTAPATPGTYHVVAASNANPARKATAQVTVLEGIVVTVSSQQTGDLEVNKKRTFTASVAGTEKQAVTWSVQEGAAGGTITQEGVYTAPATPGTYHVVAASQEDLERTDSLEVVVVAAPEPPKLTVTIQQSAPQVNTLETLDFDATVTHAQADDTVSWSVEGEDSGTITAEGVYTAPAMAGTYTIVATSNEDTTKQDTVEVVVNPVLIAVMPQNAAVPTGGTLALTATVTGATNQGLTWEVMQGGVGGTVTATETGATYQAPATGGTDTLRVTSQHNPNYHVDVTVTVNPISVTVAPTEVTLLTGAQQTFTATVSNDPSNLGVTWSVQEQDGGTITPDGVYTAPATPGTYTVTVTSNEDPSKTDTVTINALWPVTANLYAHYAADKIAGVADGADVTTWDDLTGNAANQLYFPTGETGKAPPTLATQALNGRPAVAFNGTTQFLRTALFAAPLPQPTTLFVVFKSSAGAKSTLIDSPKLNATTANPNRNRIQITYPGSVTQSPNFRVQLHAGDFTGESIVDAPFAAFHAVMGQYNGQQSRLRLDGKEETNSGWVLSSTKPGTGGLNGILLGLKQDLSQNPGQAQIAEVLVYSVGLDTTQIQQVEAYLRVKYGLPNAGASQQP